jgi:hypothetical protein
MGRVTMRRPADRRVRPARRRQEGDGLRRARRALVQLITGGALLLCTLIAVTAVSLGIARAQVIGSASDPDTGLVLALFAIAIAVMGLLSAAAVRFAGRPRQR